MRALARWGITPLLAAPVGAWALGLGNIELKSALNQPFQAQIEVVSATPDELQGLKVGLAPPEMFERYGLDRPAFLQNLEFRVVSDRSGRGVVQVTSAQSITEPFVTLLVEAIWPRGRVLREFTVLLDPPVLLPAPATPQAVQPAETRPTSSNSSGGAINRPAPQQPARQPTPEPVAPQAAPGPVSRTESEPAAPVSRSAPPRAPASVAGGAYGPVQRGDTLWVIADRFRPENVTINQMMVAMYRSNPDAFGGNINLLRAGASLHLPEATDFDQLTRTAANTEVQRQTDEWSSRPASGGQLRLLPPAVTEVARTPAPTRVPSTGAGAGAAPSTSNTNTAAAAAASPAPAPATDTRRPVEVASPTLQNLQQQAAAATAPPAAAAGGAAGVDLEKEQVFADDKPENAAAAAATPAPAAPAPVPAPVATGPSLLSQVLDWVTSPLLLISLGVAALLVIALLFVRRRRQEQQEPEGITGRWEQLESEVADDQVREATERMRRQLPEQTIVVEEQRPERSPRAEAEEERRAPAKPARAERPAPAAAVPTEETLSNQTVINLDQADAVAEADFHMAYGLYDQAAELVQKALEASPNRRDLKLKLLEVFFVWGNKDSFLKSAQNLRSEIGLGADADWDKVVIMGRQICPGEKLFTDSTAAAGTVDVDLEAGDSPLDLAFDEVPESGSAMDDVGAALDFNLETSDERPAPKAAQPKPAAKPIPARGLGDDSLDIGAQTAAGLEAALFAPEEEGIEIDGSDTDVGGDALSITQESPTIERARPGDLNFSVDAPTVETPTIESPAAGSATLVETVETPFRRGDSPTVEHPALGGGSGSGEFTAEIDLDDLGLDVKDIEGLPQDLGDLPTAAGRETDTREQPALRVDDELLSATGVTKVLRDSDAEDDDLEQSKTSVLSDGDATMLAPGFGDSTMTGTEVLDNRFEVDDQSGDTSLVRSLKKDEGIDLDLADLTQALHGADTVEQPRAQTFSREVFGGGETPLDLDVGNDPLLNDEDPTGTEGASPLDPQTMTEVGTKLDLARAYIDMGDPEGARSILEEVLDEGDPNQRREAQSLIDVLTA